MRITGHEGACSVPENWFLSGPCAASKQRTAQSATHRPAAVDCRALLALNAGHEEAPSGVLVVFAPVRPFADRGFSFPAPSPLKPSLTAGLYRHGRDGGDNKKGGCTALGPRRAISPSQQRCAGASPQMLRRCNPQRRLLSKGASGAPAAFTQCKAEPHAPLGLVALVRLVAPADQEGRPVLSHLAYHAHLSDRSNREGPHHPSFPHRSRLRPLATPVQADALHAFYRPLTSIRAPHQL